MANKKSVDFLPEVFQTPTNTKFLNSTLDQLIQEPKLKQTQGYIGNKVTNSKLQEDTYINELNDDRTNYQFEPSVVFNKNGKKIDAITYPGIVDGLRVKGAITDNHNRLFSSNTYSWSPLIDFDKFVNYSQYYWLPSGPESVDILTNKLLDNDSFDIIRDDFNEVYNVITIPGDNPPISVIRNGTYVFNINQPGHKLYIQTHPGNGSVPWADNISSRNILGITNNGEDDGTITFNVPTKNAQNFYYELPDVGPVDIATELKYDEVDGELLSDLISLNDTRDLDAKTIVFINDNNNRDIYQIQLVYDINGINPVINLIRFKILNANEKFTIEYGTVFSNRVFYKNTGGFIEEIPFLTSTLEQLYYQDATDPTIFGVINIIDETEQNTLIIDDIIGKETYTSQNGVIFTNGLKIKPRGLTEPEEYSEQEYYVEGVGDSINLIKVTDLITPEKYTRTIKIPWDTTGWDTSGWNGNANTPIDLDYLTINRASFDLNAWTRSNRWFHIDVILQTAEYNRTVAQIDNNFRAKRPIIEFEPNLRLFNSGTKHKTPIDVVDFVETDALSNINGASGYIVDGYELVNDSRIVFASDLDSSVRNKIYTVKIVDTNDDGDTIINLTVAEDAEILENETLLIIHGTKNRGETYSYIDGSWSLSQLKESINQPPLFDIYDNTGISYSDSELYTSSTFTGTKLFSYKVGNGINDDNLGFPLSYLNIGNLGDIVFENNLYLDTFLYVDGLKSSEQKIEKGFIRQYINRTEFNTELGWTPSVEFNYIPQVYDILYNGNSVVLDVIPKKDLNVPSIKVQVNNFFVSPNEYSIDISGNNTIITFNSFIETGTEIIVDIITDDISENAYYKVPSNISSNMFNENVELFTLGTVRNHYTDLAHNITGIKGNINGSNNVRDLGKVSKYGKIITQQSAPMSLLGQFIRTNEYNFFDAVNFNAREYEKYKNLIIDTVSKTDIGDLLPSELLEQALISINAGKNIFGSFYYSDMVPSGTDFIETIYIYSVISTDTFNTENVYNFNEANYKALLVYVNNVLQIKDLDYTVAIDSPQITFLKELIVDDVILIKEYNSTIGSYVPETPSKLGLYPKFEPKLFIDDTYVTPILAIRGHDGSITPAYNDFRDDVLLEYELRIYNNIKVNSDIPITETDIRQGQFRDTDYKDSEITEIMSTSILGWIGENKIDYKLQDYRIDNEKTWNYSKSGNKLDDKILKGHWRGIYKFYYDTDSPHIRPWEMLGLSVQPNWWIKRYGPAPYTSGNKNLWDDLEIGLIKDPFNERISSKHVRPGLSEVIPVDSSGNLLTPINVMATNYSYYDFKSAWRIGDVSPAETAFNRSSSYPFALQRLYALTKPAQYFSLMVDRDRYKFNYEHTQYLYDDRLRLDSRNIEIVGNNPKHSYINWIANYNIHYGYNSINELSNSLSDMTINLCYRMASFTDKNNLKLFADKSSPDSTNGSLLIPDESYTLLLYKNQAFDKIIYSGISIQKVQGGFSVTGNSVTNPYFRILQSIPNNNYKTYYVGQTISNSTKIRVPVDFTDTFVFIPYGYVFNNMHLVVDFIASYGKLLEIQGMSFNNTYNNEELTWDTMIKEFVRWNDQGWGNGSIININPSADTIEFERNLTIVDSLLKLAVTEQPQDQNRQQLDAENYSIDRIGNNFKLIPLNETVLGYLSFELTNTEHLLILDNVSIFNDLMYDTITGIRQERIKIHGFVSNDWTGRLEAPGFMLNEDNVEEWNNNKSYNEGNLIQFKNEYWTANKTVQPQEEFNFANWTKIDYNTISTGLIANAATKADSMLRFYDNHTANLESDADLLSLALTGFIPRQYLSGLDLDDISQVNIYRDIIESKGTSDSLDLFRNIRFNNEPTNYEIFENWAVQRATYGATSSKSFIEFRLLEDNHVTIPSVIEIVDDISTSSTANQIISVDNIYKQSIKHNNKNIFPIINEKITDTNLPTAGFVKRDQVDIAIFSIDNLLGIDLELDKIIEGTLIWIAKDTKYDWNVYKVNAISPNVIRVSDNLDGTITITFDEAHKVLKNEIVIIKYLDDLVDRTYIVTEINHPKTIVVNGALNSDRTTIEEKGIGFVLRTARVNKPSSIIGTTYDNELFQDDKIWVSNDNEKHKIYKKSAPYKPLVDIHNPDISNSDTGFSYDITQNVAGTVLVISEPKSNNGIIYIYNKSDNNYKLKTSIDTTAVGINFIDTITNFGSVVNMANNVIVVSATSMDTNGSVFIVSLDKNNNVFTITQTLTRHNSNGFGNDVIISNNENWIYVGEYANNQIHAYQQIEYQDQRFSIISDGVTTDYEYDSIVVVNNNNANQIIVTIDNSSLIANVDYTVSNGVMSLVQPAPVNTIISIIRRSSIVFNGDDVDVNTISDYTIDDIYTFTDEDSVSIYLNNRLCRNYYDYKINNKTITFIDANGNDVALLASDAITVSTSTYYRYTNTITNPNPYMDSNGVDQSNFGYKLSTSFNGSQLTITSPNSKVNGIDGVGISYIYSRSIERTVINDINQITYNVSNIDVNSYYQAYINGIKLKPETYNNAEYKQGNNSIELYYDVNIGDFLDIDANDLLLIQTIHNDTLIKNNNFGSSIILSDDKDNMFIATKNDSAIKLEAGSVQRFINASIVRGVISSTNKNPLIVTSGTILINNIPLVVSAGATVESIAININNAIIPNVKASSMNGYLIIELINKAISSLANKLEVLPGQGSIFEDLGFNTFELDQLITQPNPQYYNHFGSTIEYNNINKQLFISSINANTMKLVKFDNRDTTFDGRTMRVIDEYKNSGAVYSYDFMNDALDFTAGGYVFGQQLYDSNADLFTKYVTADTSKIRADSDKVFNGLTKDDFNDISVSSNSKYGFALSVANNRLMVSSLNHSHPILNTGRVLVFENISNQPSWYPIYEEQEQVDNRLINTVKLYNSETETLIQYLDYIDPLNGKILGVVKENIDYITTIDPASYKSSISKVYWGETQIGDVWWDITNARFLDYRDENSNKSAKLWGNLFPGSSIDVYEWIETENPPVAYTGEGTPKNNTDFVSISTINSNNTIENVYYYWVKNIKVINDKNLKTLSVYDLASYIESPQSSGLPYIMFIKPNTLGLMNTNRLLNEDTSILHIEYDKIKNDNNVFVEFDLIRENNAEDFLTDTLYKKLLDSFCGVDTIGNLVPDVNLSTGEKYGIDFRPRQSMFKDRFAALKSYILRVNNLVEHYTVAEGTDYPLLNSEEEYPIIGSGAWDIKVLDLQELKFQNLDEVSTGYKILVQNDSDNNNLWTIYEVEDDKSLFLNRVQHYDTTRYWDFKDWYATGYNELVKIDKVVNIFSDLQVISLNDNFVVKVNENSNGLWELYTVIDTNWERVGLEQGTIQFSEALYNYEVGRSGFDVEVFDVQYFDEEPVIETRNIIRSINEEILTGSLQVERNKILMSVFAYVLSEQMTVNWLYKTSLLDVNHKVRSLLPYSSYKKDNQNYVFKYIEETKPYHCKVKEFLLRYDGFDIMEGNITDFDCPSYYNTDFEQFISPVLDDGAILKTDNSNVKADDEIWNNIPWLDWFNNRSLVFNSVIITNAGTGYTVPPQIDVIGESETPATLIAKVNKNGNVSEIIVINPGSGFKHTPALIISGGNGFGATAIVETKNNLIRSFSTKIKYDRYEYKSAVINWEPETDLLINDLVRYNNKVYKVIEDNIDETFMSSKYDLVDIETLSGVDRTMGYYIPDENDPGLDLSLLLNGISYPGVDVTGKKFEEDDGFDGNANFDMRPYDIANNLIDDSESNVGLDTIYESIFPGQDRTEIQLPGIGPEYIYSINKYSDSLASYSGTTATDIDVTGGKFIDTYHSHAPEELIPGAVFDTLDLRVYEQPGWDYYNRGYAFGLDSIVYPIEGDSTYEFPTADTSKYTADENIIINNHIDLGIVYNLKFNNPPELPVTILMYNITTGRALYEYYDYIPNWNERTVAIINGANTGDHVILTLGGLGGGDQLYRRSIPGTDMSITQYDSLDANGNIIPVIINSYTVPVQIQDINKALVFVNGFQLLDSSLEIHQPTIINTSSIPFTEEIIDIYSVELAFASNPTDIISIAILGDKSPNEENLYQVTTFDVGGSNDAVFNSSFFNVDTFSDPSNTLTEFILDSGKVSNITQQMNAVVEQDGLRERSPEGIRYYGNAIEINFNLPDTTNITQFDILDEEVVVIIDGVKQDLIDDYRISPPGGYDSDNASFNTARFNNATFYDPAPKTRYVIFRNAPRNGTKIEIYVTTEVGYSFVNDELLFDVAPEAGVILGVVSYGDISELNILTEVFQGPTILSEERIGKWDLHSFGTAPWSENQGIDLRKNIFKLSQDSELYLDRLWVTLNGRRLNPGTHYDIFNNEYVRIFGDILNTNDVIVITSMTNNEVSNGLQFRYFKDMRDNSAMYSMSRSYETELAQDVNITDDIIYLKDVSVLTIPDTNSGIFGIIMINAERITYRGIDTVNNTVNDLRRGTAGTAITEHLKDSFVYNMNKTALVPESLVLSNFESHLTESIEIDEFDNIFSITGNGLIMEPDIMYVYNAKDLSELLFERTGRGEIQIGNYKITFTSKDIDNNTISGLTLEKILRCNNSESSVPDMVVCDDTVYNKEFNKGTPIKNMARDYVFINNDQNALLDNLYNQQRLNIFFQGKD